MNFQSTGDGEFLVTKTASVRSLASVDPNVSCEITFVDETLTTRIATVWSLAGVRSHVSLESTEECLW